MGPSVTVVICSNHMKEQFMASMVTEVQSFELSLPHIDTFLLFLVETVFSILVAP